MKTLYLRTDTEAEMIAALPWARGPDQDGVEQWRTVGFINDQRFDLDIIGAIPPTLDANGVPVAGTGDTRFHVNYIGPGGVVPASAIADPPPASPHRRFAV